MSQLLLIVIWILATLLISSGSALLGKRYGVEYPIAMVAALVVVANILANKIVVFGPFSVPAGVIVFSSTFLITDILSEKWGKATARKAVWAGFYANIVMVISVWIALAWQSPDFVQESANIFNQALGLTPRIVFASMIAYLLSQHHDVWAFHFWKDKTKGKYLWLRNNLSTAVSQLIDSIVFIVIAFAGVLPLIPLIIGQYVVKMAIALLDTPFMYLITSWMDKVQRVE